MWFAATALTLAGGLAAVYRSVRDFAAPSIAAWTVTALVFATALWPTLLDDSPTAFAAAVSFAGAAVSVWLAWMPKAGGRLRGAAAGLWLGALAVPYAVGGALPRPSLVTFGEAFFSSSRGLFFWSPLLWVGVFGMARLARTDSSKASTAFLALLVVGLLASGPGGDGPIAAGRFHPALPFLGLGLAVGLTGLRNAFERRPALPLLAVGLALTVWNFLFMEQYRTGRVPRDLPVSFAEVTQMNVAIFARLFGSPTAWPANWLFAWRYDITAAKYDVVVGQGPWSPGFLAIRDERVDPNLLAEGWGVRTSCGTLPCRRVLGSARILLPLGPGGPFPTTLRLAGPASVIVRVNHEPVITETLGPGPIDVPLPRGSGAWVRGVNEIAVTSAPAGAAGVLGLSLGDVR
jgi:hypothetical protein